MNQIFNSKIIFFLFVFLSGDVLATEEPTYIIESKNDIYEIRIYNSILVAETLIESKFDEAGNIAFKILADYIFGNNSSRNSLDMTAPVTQVKSEKIEMTAPVTLSKINLNITKLPEPSLKSINQEYSVQFTMPAKFKIDTLPKPNDERVNIREIPKRKIAVFSYSGSWSESRYQKKLSEFTAVLKKDNVITKGEPVFARYNSPFRLWFLRRNEIWLEVIK